MRLSDLVLMLLTVVVASGFTFVFYGPLTALVVTNGGIVGSLVATAGWLVLIDSRRRWPGVGVLTRVRRMLAE